MNTSDVQKLMERRTKQCLVHRYLYYIKASPLVDDLFYDKLERELRSLVQEYPEVAKRVPFAYEVCNTPGSDLIDSYARLEGIEQLAESLLAYSRTLTGVICERAIPKRVKII